MPKDTSFLPLRMAVDANQLSTPNYDQIKPSTQPKPQSIQNSGLKCLNPFGCFSSTVFPDSSSLVHRQQLGLSWSINSRPSESLQPDEINRDEYKWLDDSREDAQINELLDKRYRESKVQFDNKYTHMLANIQLPSPLQTQQGWSAMQSLPPNSVVVDQNITVPHDPLYQDPPAYTYQSPTGSPHRGACLTKFRSPNFYQEILSTLEASLATKEWGVFFHNTKILLNLPEGKSLDLFTLRVYAINMMIFTMVRDPRPYEKIVKKLTLAQRRHIVIEKILGICSTAWKKTDKDYRLDCLLYRYSQIHSDPKFERYILGCDEAIEILGNLVTLTRLRAAAFILKKYSDLGASTCPIAYVSFHLAFGDTLQSHQSCYAFLASSLKPPSVNDVTPTGIIVSERLRDHIKAEINGRKRVYWEVVLKFRKAQNALRKNAMTGPATGTAFFGTETGMGTEMGGMNISCNSPSPLSNYTPFMQMPFSHMFNFQATIPTDLTGRLISGVGRLSLNNSPTDDRYCGSTPMDHMSPISFSVSNSNSNDASPTVLSETHARGHPQRDRQEKTAIGASI